MLQLILHLIGDYITQTDYMANNKTKSLPIAFLHAFVYTVPFIILTQSPIALLVIMVSHAIIDHYRLARFVIFAKNYLNDPTLKWADCNKTGYPNSRPEWLTVWLLIIADNTLHLTINYIAISYL
jgi:hypothetical protein